MFWCKSNPVERRDHQSQPPFYPRPPRGGRRPVPYLPGPPYWISIHVSREGDAAAGVAGGDVGAVFLSTSPARGTTRMAAVWWWAWIFLSTSPARGTTPNHPRHYPRLLISIHVPREGDDRRQHTGPARGTISIHVPREGDDRPPWPATSSMPSFLSTSPARGTTAWLRLHKDVVQDFYPRPPRGGRPLPMSALT